MIYSYSSISLYRNCPRHFFHKYVARDAVPRSHDAAAAGTQVHEAIETALKTRSPLAGGLEIYETTISSVRKKIDHARIEQTIFLDQHFDFAVTKPEKGFVAKLDVLILSEDEKSAMVIDWKTGKPREDTLQHDCYALAVMKAFPGVDRVTGCNVYLKTGTTSKAQTYLREGLPENQGRIAVEVARIEADDHWAMKPGPLCNWCSATKCKFHPETNK